SCDRSLAADQRWARFEEEALAWIVDGCLRMIDDGEDYLSSMSPCFLSSPIVGLEPRRNRSLAAAITAALSVDDGEPN
ncbi:hypothetical protein ACLOJK_014587, partial [Asimina triloba]